MQGHCEANKRHPYGNPPSLQTVLSGISRAMLAFWVVLGLIAALSGCSDNKARLTFWVGGAPQEVDYWEKLVADFAKHSGIDVEVIRQPVATEQRKQGLVMALASGRPDPDVFLMDIVWLSQFVQSDWLAPLDRYFKENTLQPQQFFPSVVERVDRYKDRYYALPAFMDVGLLYYRSDLLQRHGFNDPPATWDELVEQALAVQTAERRDNPGFNGFVWQGAQYEGLVCTFLEFIATHGGGISVNGTVNVSLSGNEKALQFMQDLVRRHRISPPNTYTEMKEEEVRRSFQRGNALFERNWLYAWGLHQRPESAVRGRIGLAALPHLPGAETAAALGGWHLGISKTSDVKDRAWELAEFLLSRSTQKKLLMKLGWYSCRKDVYLDPEVQTKVANVEKLKQIVSHAVSRPNLAYYDQVSRIIQRYVNDCLAGKQTARQAITVMQQEIDRVEGIYGNP